MNERIRLLISQLGGIGYDDDSNELTPSLVGKDLEKFAELIIKETLQVARVGVEYGPSMEDAVYKYFGVEE